MTRNKKGSDKSSTHRTVVLSDGGNCEVRILSLFETRDIPIDWDEPFTYEIVSHTGRAYTVKFPFHEYKEEPKKPDTPRHEVVEKTKAYDDWRTWELYQAAKLHYQEMERRLRRYLDAVTDRILSSCIGKEDVKRIITLDDIEKVRQAALTRPVSKEVLQSVLKNHYNASFDGDDVLEQLFADGGDDDGGRYAAIMSWEVKLMNSLGLSPEEYSFLPVAERALRICAENLSSWMESLELRKMSRKDGGRWHPLGAMDPNSALA